ncbi:MFS transporter [Kitasatospora aureofaciens]|uniref:MFS transporter n=1 Tax=Kitasatospora aureofaciens TaxID=1894 RepID=UPI0037CB0B2B
MTARLGKRYWLLWSSSSLAALGDGMRLVALPLLAYSVTDDPGNITLIMVFASLPGLLVGPLAGVLVDRLDRRRVIAAANVLRAVPVLVFAAFVQSGDVRLPLVYALALLLPVFEVMVDSAVQPLMSELLPEALLEKGNSRIFIARMLAQDVLGSPVAGALMAVSASLPFLVNGATFLGATVLVLLLGARSAVRGPLPAAVAAPGRDAPDGGAARVWRDLKEGMAAIWHTPMLRTIALTSAVLNFVLLVGSSLLVIYAKEDLRLTDTQFALLFSAAAVGSALGGWAAPHIVERLGTRLTMTVGLVAIGASRAGFGLAHGFWSALTAFFAIGTAWFVFGVAVTSYMQRATPNSLVGRVYATSQALSYGAAVLAALTAGALARVTSVRSIMLIGGLAAIACGLVAWRTTSPGPDRDGRAAAEDQDNGPAAVGPDADRAERPEFADDLNTQALD